MRSITEFYGTAHFMSFFVFFVYFAAAESQQMTIFGQLLHTHHNRMSCSWGQKSDNYQIISSNYFYTLKIRGPRGMI